MMNRDVMSRQMFANGGAAFPDLSGGGNVTQKDILIGRGIIPMQDGGMAPMPMPAAPGPQMMPPGLPAVDPNSVDINQAAQAAMQQGIDPAIMEGMLTKYSQGMEDLENAEDYETVMNGIRGDDLPIEQRYQELASLVGPEDSQQTPESVLTLLQPVMMLAAVDQGIGGLAAEEMSAPVEGAMAEGIMSTVNMGAPEAPVQVPGGPAPVNFNQGGAVQYMQTGGVSLTDPRLQALFDQQRALTSSIYGEADQEAELSEQQKMTKAQMLFDVAQGALGFAGGAGHPGASPAEQLAAAFTPVMGNIGQRAGELGKFKQAQKDRSLKLNLSNLQTAQAALQSEKAIAAAAANVKPGDSYMITDAEGNVLWQGPVGTVGQQNALMKQYPSGVTFTKVKEPKAPSYATFINPVDPTDVLTFNASDLSPANIAAMEAARLAVKADGSPRYRITGKFIPKSDSVDIFGKGLLGMVKNLLEGEGSADLAKRYAAGQTTPDETNQIEGAIGYYTNPQKVWNAETQVFEMVAPNRLIDVWGEALKTRRGMEGVSMPPIGQSEMDRLGLGKTAEPDAPAGAPPPDGVPLTETTYDSLTKEIASIGAIGDLTGRSAALKNWVNRGTEFMVGSPFFADTAKAQNLVQTINTTAMAAIMQAISGKESEALRQELKDIVPPVAAFTRGSEVALNKTRGFEAYLNLQIRALNSRINAPQPPGNVGELRQNAQILASYRDVYKKIGDMLEAGGASEKDKALRNEQFPLSRFMRTLPEKKAGGK